MRKIGIMLVGLLVASTTMVAQRGNEPGRKQDPAQRAEKMTERMVKEYSLNDAQKQQVYEMNLAMAEKMKDHPPMRMPNKKMRPGKGTCECNCCCSKKEAPGEMADKPAPDKEQMEKMREEMKQSRDAYNEKIKGIFTAEQYAAYEKNQSGRQDRMKDKKVKGEKKDNNTGKKP